MSKAIFERKAFDVDNLDWNMRVEHLKEMGNDYAIEKVITLDKVEYENFINDFLEDRDFIKDNIDLMYINSDKVWHCVCIICDDINCDEYGILVEAEGYGYARYVALIKRN